MKPKILIVDDTPDICELLEAVLGRNGFDTVSANNGTQMDAVLKTGPVDLIILDVMMPGEDGFSICRRITAAGGPPIILLSARQADFDKVEGLDLGAEDYVAKPFSNDELLARVRVVLRRSKRAETTPAPAETWTFCGWTLDKQTRKLSSPAGRVLALSPAEFALFKVFLDRPGRPLRRDQILDAMDDVHGFSTPRGLDTLVSRLRQKIKYADPRFSGANELIETVYGVGYMLRPDSPAES